MLACAALVLAAMLVFATRSHADPEGPGTILVCATVSPGAQVQNGGDANLLLVGQATHGRLTGPNIVMHVGFIGCATAHGCFPDLDLDDDGDFDNADIQVFVNVLLGLDTSPIRRQNADQNCDGATDGEDIQFFVNAAIP